MMLEFGGHVNGARVDSRSLVGAIEGGQARAGDPLVLADIYLGIKYINDQADVLSCMKWPCKLLWWWLHGVDALRLRCAAHAGPNGAAMRWLAVNGEVPNVKSGDFGWVKKLHLLAYYDKQGHAKLSLSGECLRQEPPRSWGCDHYIKDRVGP